MRLLLLAGSAEAREIALALAGRPGLEVIASLAGLTRAAPRLACATRTGGFGGDEGFAKYLQDNAIDAVLDATHPFAARVSARSAAICRGRGLPFLHLSRPAWSAGPGDRWTGVADEAEAARHIPPGATVFLATGSQRLEAFRDLGRRGCRVICRRIDPPPAPFPFPGGAWTVGRPPFRVEDETRLFARLGIEFLVVRNAGGPASRPKLDAARALALPVLMIRRPAPPQDCRIAASVAEALDWVEGLT